MWLPGQNAFALTVCRLLGTPVLTFLTAVVDLAADGGIGFRHLDRCGRFRLVDGLVFTAVVSQAGHGDDILAAIYL